MANAPTPRSYNQILGGMISAFIARFPIRNLKVGGPILSILEAAAQSDLRNTAETFTLLASSSLDSAEGTALDRIMADENTKRIGAAPSTGVVSVTDSRYTKLASVLYQGKPAPLAGSTTLYVTDALTWPTSGSVYVGRGTQSYEGPLQYTSITPPGPGESFYTITLSVLYPTSQYHNLGETVVVAQGGDRTIPAGSIVQTPQGNTASAVQFSVLYSVVLPDGEVSVDGVQIICTQPGTIGNVVGGAITEFLSPPFTGAVCSNTLALVNGIEVETDTEARARVRNLRQSRTRGTNTAIETYLLGVTSPDENKRIASAKVVDREGYPTTVYVDDGTGYEEVPVGVPYEVLTHSASGGEEYFQLALGRPVTKAHVSTVTSEPWNIVPLSTLTVNVGGIPSVHTFNSSDFRSPVNAAAYEVVQSINANPNIDFSARTHDNNSKVVIFAKADSNEDVQVVPASGTTDANDVLQFSTNLALTAHIYKNDILLSKDGSPASVVTMPWGSWGAIADGDVLTISVDGTPEQTIDFYDSDFSDAGTGYFSVSAANSLAAWAAVFNYKIPGITAVVEGDHLRLFSNLGAVPRGAISINSGSSVAVAMFSDYESTARPLDYALNRNTGQLHMDTPLSVTDKLTAGTKYTRGFLESERIASTTAVATSSNMFLLFDSAAEFIPLSLTTSMTFEVSIGTTLDAYTEYVEVACNTSIFGDVLPGDLVMFWDTVFANRFPVPLRVAESSASVIKVQVPIGSVTASAPGLILAKGGITVARTNAFPYLVNIPSSGFYTAESLATAVSSAIAPTTGLWASGGNAEVIRNGYARIRTNTYGPSGDVALLGTDREDVRTIWEAGVVKPGGVSHLASAESGTAENDTTIFKPLTQNFGNSNVINNAQMDIPLTPDYMNSMDASIIVTALRSLPKPIGT
jgi:uncharacterized phage protein gp47/JayE